MEYVQKTKHRYAELYEEYVRLLGKGKKPALPQDIAFDHLSNIFYCSDSERAMNLSAEATRFAVEKVFNGEWTNAYVVTRPPGHHARKNGLETEPEGFCFFNNAAIAAKWLQWYNSQKHNSEGKVLPSSEKSKTKVLIFDWDVHHGDGTQDIFYNTNETLFVSTHQFENATFYPLGGTGHHEKIGEGEGKGFNINVDWNLGNRNKLVCNDYFYIFKKVLFPIIQNFSPEMIIVSAGFDSCRGDKLGHCHLSPRLYYNVTQEFKKVQKKIVVSLEGGYTIENVQDCSVACLLGLMDMSEKDIKGTGFDREVCNLNAVLQEASKKQERDALKVGTMTRSQRKALQQADEKNKSPEDNFDRYRGWFLEPIEISKIIPQEYVIEKCVDIIDAVGDYWPELSSYFDSLALELDQMRERRKKLDTVADLFSQNIWIQVLHHDTIVINMVKCKPDKITAVKDCIYSKLPSKVSELGYYDEEENLFIINLKQDLTLKFDETENIEYLGFGMMSETYTQMQMSYLSRPKLMVSDYFHQIIAIFN